MYIRRKIETTIQAGAKQIPVVAIIGPRQSGKSTLAKKMFPNHVYVDMQDAQIFEFANSDPKGFLNTYRNEHGIIIDEAQYAPNLFPQIKVEADRNPQPGYYILSGSQNFLLHEKISESLAGRVYFYTLLPFSIEELKQANLLLAHPNNQIFKGFYPRVYQPKINPYEYYQNYISTYVERDIRSLRNIENILTFQKFMQLCAIRIASTLNITELAAQCGVGINTAKGWLGLLEASFIIFHLAPHYNNFGRRLVKSPKLYFYDVGLAATLMNIDRSIITHNRLVYGALFENMMIADIIKNYNNRAQKPSLSFLRDSNKNEIDLIIEHRGQTIPVEIKAAETISNKFFTTVLWFKQAANIEKSPIILYGGKEKQIRSNLSIIPWTDTDNIQ